MVAATLFQPITSEGIRAANEVPAAGWAQFSPRLSPDEAAKLASKNGLPESGVRPPLGVYIRKVWERRYFIWELARARSFARNQGSYLGQAWNILNPVLSSAVFVIVFGFILQSNRGVSNFAAFITSGALAYDFFTNSVTSSLTSLQSDIQLIRSHNFPRAVVPLAAAFAEIVSFGPVLVAMLLISFLTGLLPQPMFGFVPPTWKWLLLPVAAAIMSVFNAGCALIFARIGARLPDLRNLIPFFLNLGRFLSGVMFSLAAFTSATSWRGIVARFQPVALLLDLFRQALGNEPAYPLRPLFWLLAAAWAVLIFVIGFVFFWGAEETYGRD